MSENPHNSHEGTHPVHGGTHTSHEGRNLFAPVLLVALALGLFLVSQAVTEWGVVSNLQRQRTQLGQQIQQASQQVAPSRNLQAILQSFASDLLNLSASDAEVRRVAEKYQIRRTPPPSAPAK